MNIVKARKKDSKTSIAGTKSTSLMNIRIIARTREQRHDYAPLNFLNIAISGIVRVWVSPKDVMRQLMWAAPTLQLDARNVVGCLDHRIAE